MIELSKEIYNKNRVWPLSLLLQHNANLMSKYYFLLGSFLMLFTNSFCQNYHQQIQKYRADYKADFLKDEKSPLTKEDLQFLRFYPANINYKIKANFTRVADTTGFDMQTHSGVIRKYYVYGIVEFLLKKRKQKLYIYQSQKLMTKEGFEDYLFLPFTDETNYKTTFGGGRYLDFKMNDIHHNRLWIDFNKCYNPLCAFKEGFACPIPPKENDLKVNIEAGEKLFAKKQE